MRNRNSAKIGCRWFVAYIPSTMETAFISKCRQLDITVGDVLRGYIDDFIKGQLPLEVPKLPDGTPCTEVKIMLKFQRIDFLRIVCAQKECRLNDLFAAFVRRFLDGFKPSNME